jgi:hypothetical protein
MQMTRAVLLTALFITSLPPRTMASTNSRFQASIVQAPSYVEALLRSVA